MTLLKLYYFQNMQSSFLFIIGKYDMVTPNLVLQVNLHALLIKTVVQSIALHAAYHCYSVAIYAREMLSEC